MIQINREELIRLSWDILQFVLFSPLTNHALLLYLVVGYLTVGVVLGKVHGIGNAARSSIFVGLFTALFGIFALIQIAALSKMYLLPLLKVTANSTLAWMALILTAFFLLVIPFTRACFHAGYWTSCGSWLCALLVGALAIFGTRTVYNPKPRNDKEAVTNFDTFARGVQKEIKEQVDQRLEQFK
jgi:hypothetical protein